MSAENLKALSRLAALISEGYPFAALQSKIKSQRIDAIAPQGAHATLLEVFNQLRLDANLAQVQLVVGCHRPRGRGHSSRPSRTFARCRDSRVPILGDPPARAPKP